MKAIAKRGASSESIACEGKPGPMRTAWRGARVPRGRVCGPPAPLQRYPKGRPQGRAVRETAPGGRRQRCDAAYHPGRQSARVPRLRSEERVKWERGTCRAGIRRPDRHRPNLAGGRGRVSSGRTHKYRENYMRLLTTAALTCLLATAILTAASSHQPIRPTRPASSA